jgi:predicted unusual protein kinase regulating ubiquinone biosynthesis (AarF/ABC1/UbiB family)
VESFITVGVSAALRQLLEFGLFHGDPHPGNIFAMRDGRIAYVDFGNVAELSQVRRSYLHTWLSAESTALEQVIEMCSPLVGTAHVHAYLWSKVVSPWLSILQTLPSSIR